jgi:hypothetical protein
VYFERNNDLMSVIMTVFYRCICFSICCFILVGCSSFKDVSNPYKLEPKKQTSSEKTHALSKHDEIGLYFFRPKSFLTLGQKVELYVDGNQIGTLGHNDKIHFNSKPGTHKLTTKVGLSLGLAVTGLGGACKFSDNYSLTREKHFFKIEFSPGLLCGEHEVIEISESDFQKL